MNPFIPSDTKKSESIGNTHKPQIPIQENGDGQEINYYTMKGKTLRINNLNKLAHFNHRDITPVWRVIRTFKMDVVGNGNPYKYEIYLERLGAIPPNVIQINIYPTIKTNNYVEVEIQRYVNTSIASTSSPKIWKTQVEIENLKTLEDFKEYLREGVITLFGKTI